MDQQKREQILNQLKSLCDTQAPLFPCVKICGWIRKRTSFLF